MTSTGLFQSRTTIQHGFFHGELLPVAFAWTAIATLCHYNVIPLTNSRTQQTAVHQTTKLPHWLNSQYVDAALVFAFHAIVSANDRHNVWVLPLIAIAISFSPQSNANLDSHVVNIGNFVAGWRITYKHNDLADLKPVIWLVATVLSVIIALLAGCHPVEFLIGLALVSIGVLLYIIVPESISRQGYVTSRELQQRILLPIALPSIGCALVIWIILGPQIIPLPSLLLLSIVSATKALAVFLSVADGTALPALAALSAAAVLRSAAVTPSSSLLAIGILLLSAVIQFVLSLPKAPEKQRHLLLFVFTPLLLTTIIEGYHANSSFSLLPTSYKHPIQLLHETSLARFEHKVSTQSRTATEAAAEYRRRYVRKPPPNFDKWFKLAKANDFQLIDEFDVVMSSIIPYWGLGSDLLHDRVKAIKKAPGVLTFEMRENNASFTPDHYHGPILAKWINKYTDYKLFPDFNFTINTFDEPRINAPYEIVKAATDRARILVAGDDGYADVSWLDLSQKNLELDLLPACPLHADESTIDEFPLKLVSNLTASKDYCHEPSLFSTHGFFQAPETLIVSRTLVPLLSQCKPDRFNDIIYPSPYYTYETDFENIDDDEDPDWQYKLDRLYWSGSSTGGHSTTNNWKHLHRQHLALLTSTESNTALQLLQKSKSSLTGWSTYNTTWNDVKDLTAIRLNRLVQCDEEACDAMRASFPLVGGSDPIEMSFESKYSFDMDGNAFTGRFYRLLRSKVCVLKMSIFKEWHDDFLTPWVHYIPVSAGFSELGEVLRFLTSDPNGKVVGKAVADNGRAWGRKVLREQDFEIVTMRILMEVARLVNGDAEEDALASD